MARLGLKKQGALWGVFRGGEMITGPASDAAKNGKDLGPEDQLTYDNNTEYANLRMAWDEARAEPALAAPARQQERERLEREMETLAVTLDGGKARGEPRAWDAHSEKVLETMMGKLSELLAVVGLSLHHGLGGHVGTNETAKS